MTINPTEHPVLDAIRHRWSPYRFQPRVVEDGELLRCLEAARWSASSFNDQPWTWIVARRQDTEGFQRMLGCLMETNQDWAANAGVLLLSVIRTSLAYNRKPNRVALHDLGQAAAHFALQATELGLQTHQMGGINRSLARQVYAIPEGQEPQTVIALGYPDSSEPGSDLEREMHRRETTPRTRKPLAEQVFTEKWGSQADFLS